MVSHELDPVEAATRRVLGVLGRARSFKPDGAIEPPLPVAEFATSDDLQWMHELSQLSTMKLVLERVARNIFYDVVVGSYFLSHSEQRVTYIQGLHFNNGSVLCSNMELIRCSPVL